MDSNVALPALRRNPEGVILAEEILRDFFATHADIAQSCESDIRKAYRCIVECYEAGGTLFLCGNGGSYADCLHISGELVKTFERRRPLPMEDVQRLTDDEYGREIVDELQLGLRAVPLGLSGSLVSAIWNDSQQPNIHYAQELLVMAAPGDVLLALSTSGNSRNVLYATAVARLRGVAVVTLTGPGGGRLAERADAAIRAPGGTTYRIQESHLPIYHVLCRAIEATFFPEPR
jgi:D-sedoheptulose 7-phosphate isomerase